MQIPELVNQQAVKGMRSEMTGRMLVQIGKDIVDRKPVWLLVYDDVNSTLAGTLVATNLHVSVDHVGVGLN